MDEADAEPAGDEIGLRECDGAQQLQIGFLHLAKLGIVALDHIVGQCPQSVDILSGGEILERADAHMARRHPHEDGARLRRLAIDLFACRDGGQRACSADAERMHCLREDIFPQHRAECRTAIAAAGERRRPCPLQLDIAAGSVPVDDLAYQNRPSVAELRDEGTELVAGIGHGERGGTLRYDIASKNRGQPLWVGHVRLDAELLRQALVELQEDRALHGLRIDRSVEALGQARIGIIELEQEKTPSPHQAWIWGLLPVQQTRALLGFPRAEPVRRWPGGSTCLMQFRNSGTCLMRGAGTGGTRRLPARSFAIINYGRPGQQTVISHLQKAVVIQLQLYQ